MSTALQHRADAFLPVHFSRPLPHAATLSDSMSLTWIRPLGELIKIVINVYMYRYHLIVYCYNHISTRLARP